MFARSGTWTKLYSESLSISVCARVPFGTLAGAQPGGHIGLVNGFVSTDIRGLARCFRVQSF